MILRIENFSNGEAVLSQIEALEAIELEFLCMVELSQEPRVDWPLLVLEVEPRGSRECRLELPLRSLSRRLP
jgi:hypothetical protein